MSNLPGDAFLHEQFMRLFVQHEPQILRAIMVLVPQMADARDVLQDTAVTLWQHFSNYDTGRPFVNWALGYARNHVRRYFRAAERRGKLTEKAAEALLIAAEDREGRKEKHSAALRACLHELPPPARGLIEDYYFQEKTVESLGTAYGKSVEAIYKSIQRLRRTLLDCITRRLAES